jgi:hypothetical protein
MKDTRVETANEGMIIIMHPSFINGTDCKQIVKNDLPKCLSKSSFSISLHLYKKIH